jgi:hypothetical protein
MEKLPAGAEDFTSFLENISLDGPDVGAHGRLLQPLDPMTNGDRANRHGSNSPGFREQRDWRPHEKAGSLGWMAGTRPRCVGA